MKAKVALCDDTGIFISLYRNRKDAIIEGSMYEVLEAIELGVADGLEGRPRL